MKIMVITGFQGIQKIDEHYFIESREL